MPSTIEKKIHKILNNILYNLNLEDSVVIDRIMPSETHTWCTLYFSVSNDEKFDGILELLNSEIATIDAFIQEEERSFGSKTTTMKYRCLLTYVKGSFTTRHQYYSDSDDESYDSRSTRKKYGKRKRRKRKRNYGSREKTSVYSNGIVEDTNCSCFCFIGSCLCVLFFVGIIVILLLMMY